MQPILITGAHGQLGWALQSAVAPLGPVAALDRQGLDLSDHRAIAETIAELKPSVVLNAGAYTAVDKAEEAPARAMAINGTAPGVIAEAAKAVDAAVVHFSTDYVFSGTGISDHSGALRPYVESDPVAPINTYGQSKLAGELAIDAVGGRWTTLRLAWIYDGTRGQNFLRTMLRLGASHPELSVVEDQRGAPTWVRPVAAAVAQITAAHLRGDEAAQGLFHLPAGGQTTWFEYAQHIFKRAAPRLIAQSPVVKPVSSEAWPTPAARPRYSVMSGDLLAERLGLRLPHWQAQLDLALGEITG
ncbi:MAG: dTDP-4-dehydrorhamnose reductase [Bradymonadia bacterium]